MDIYISDVKQVESSHLYHYLPMDIYISDVKQVDPKCKYPRVSNGKGELDSTCFTSEVYISMGK
jgi:hypothetical protein